MTQLRQVILSLFLFGIVTTSSAQEKTQRTAQDQFYVSVAMLGLSWYSTGPDTKWYNNALSIGVMYDKPLGKGPISIAGGLGLSVYNYHSNLRVADGRLVGNAIPLIESDSTWHGYHPLLKESDFMKNKMTWTYLDIPLELRFRTKPNNKNNYFKFNFGLKLGLLLQSHSKLVTEDFTEKYINFNHLIKYDISPSIGIGYGSWSIQTSIGFAPIRTIAGSSYEWDSSDEPMKYTVGITYHISKYAN